MDLQLSATERHDLRAMVGQQRGQARFYRRARTVLLAAEGQSISAVARTMGTCRSRVGDWLQRFQERRLEGLQDLHRSGRPAEITPLERHQVIAAACRSPADFGLQRPLWDHATLARAMMSAGLVRSISPRTVGRILQDAEIKPHHVKMWCHSDDPNYQEKMRAIVDLYVHLPKGQPVLSIDEKTGMQALSHRRPLQPASPGRRPRQDFEYKRNGTRCLFACFNVGTGRVLGRCTTTRTREDFLCFLDEVASVYRQARVHLIMDNLNTHRDTQQGDFMTRWNRRHGGRFVFHYTPTHGSWLNQVELWFCVLSRRILRYAEFRSPDELVAAIERFIREWNETDAHPFRWTYEGLPLVR
jgi:transposase